MAAGGTRAAERAPDPDPPRSLAGRLRATLAGRISDSLSAGRRLMSLSVAAGRQVVDRVWSSVTGRGRRGADTAAAEPARGAVVVRLAEDHGAPRIKSARPGGEHRNEGARVVEMESYKSNRAAHRDTPAVTAASATSDVAAEESTVETTVEQSEGAAGAHAAPWIGAEAELPDEVDTSAGGAGEEIEVAAIDAAIAPARVDDVEARDSGDEGGAGDDGGDIDDGGADDGDGAGADAAAEDGEQESVEGERLDSIIESLLLAAGAPLTVRRMCDSIRSGPVAKEVREALKRLGEHYQGPRGIHLVEVAGGYQLRTAPANARYVRALLREKPARLGRAALETLSIIAYKQPATRGEIEAIRGVDADSAINTLLAKRLVKIDGRKETVGRPLLYATTPEFLEVFGLRDLKELPTLKEIGPVAEPEDEPDIEDETGVERMRAEGALDVEVTAQEDEVSTQNGAHPDEAQAAVEEKQALGRRVEEDDDEGDEDEGEDDDLDVDDEAEDTDGFDDGFDEDLDEEEDDEDDDFGEDDDEDDDFAEDDDEEDDDFDEDGEEEDDDY